MTERTILHIDVNSFYASVEQAERPSLRHKPLAVAGKEETRNGIILAKSIEAKACGVKTAETLWEARQKCPNIIILPPNYRLYQKYSMKLRKICYEYSDLIEPFGLDELWCDISNTLSLHGGNPRLVAEEISVRIKAELGITVSIGMSWNKILAKFGSDYQKPDAITIINHDNIEKIFWSSPVEDLLYVGPASKKKLNASGYMTIGNLANAGDYYLKKRFGKVGFVLRNFAQGLDQTPVKAFDPSRNNVIRPIKSYGNGLTSPHDIVCEKDAKALLFLISESVGQRLREDYMRAATVSISVRDGRHLTVYSRQTKLNDATASTRTLAKTAWRLLSYEQSFDRQHPIRALSVRASDLEPMYKPQQLSLFEDDQAKYEELDYAIDNLRRRFGNKILVRGIEMVDDTLQDIDIKGDNTVHPVSYFNGSMG